MKKNGHQNQTELSLNPHTILQGPELKGINLSETQFLHQHCGDELLLMEHGISSTRHVVGT